MKNLIFTVITVVSTLCAVAQNGGQYQENNSVRLAHAGKIGPHYYDTLYSLQSCTSILKFDYNGTVQDVVIPANGYALMDLGIVVAGKRKARTTTHCGDTDYGWVELNLSALPLVFNGAPALTYNKDNDYIIITGVVTEVSNVNHIKLRLSFDGGKTKKELALMFLDFSNQQTVYTYKIKRTDLLGLQ